MTTGIDDNIEKHERIATQYDERHPEIYNAIEQSRLSESLSYVRSLMHTDRPKALDYGCGTGNVTQHLLSLGFEVEAADVTPKFVAIVNERFADTGQISGRILNGVDLQGCPGDHFDAVTVYSVLHHIPDYVGALRDIERVIKPGGVLFLDHEFAPGHWDPNEELLSLRAQTKVRPSISSYARRLLSPDWYIRRYRKMLNPRYQPEGDIHVWPDDHIDWDLIRTSLEYAMDVDRVTDYLYYQAHYPVAVFNEYKLQCSDLREMILRKHSKQGSFNEGSLRQLTQ